MANSNVRQKIERERRAREAAEAKERAMRARSGPHLFTTALEGAAGLRRPALEALVQADTAMRSAANALTFGVADRLDAGLDSLVGTGGLSRYRSNLGANRARNQHDAVHRRKAQLAGEIGAAGVVLGGAPLRGAAAAASKRIPSAAKISTRELGALATAGGLTNAAIQNFTDAVLDRRQSWRNGAGAFAGGAAGVLALPLGAQRAGAVSGAVGSATQDILSGRQVNVSDLARNAALGRLTTGVASEVGTRLSNGLSSQAKGRLGDRLGALRSDLNGMRIEPGPKKLEYREPGARKGGTFADGRSGDDRFEYKFGPTAALSAGQRAVQALLGDNYHVYHFLPEDVGKILGVPAMGVARQVNGDQRR